MVRSKSLHHFLLILPLFFACGGTGGASPQPDQDISVLDIGPAPGDHGSNSELPSAKDANTPADGDGGHGDLSVLDVSPPSPPCSGDLEGVTPGLDPLSIVKHPGTPGNAPHLSEIKVNQGHAYVANSFDALTVMSLDADGMSMTMAKPAGAVLPRCTTLALHAPTKSLYCTAPDRLWPKDQPKRSRIASFDLSDPAQPMIRSLNALESEDHYFRDLHVQGGYLYAAAFDAGLVRMVVQSDGALGPVSTTDVSGHVVQVSGMGSKIAILDSDRGLVLLAEEGQSLSEMAVGSLNGPLMDLTMDEERVAVALGSMGVVVFSHSGGALFSLANIQPECVVTGVALKGDALALSCTSGVYLYNLASESPALKGFIPARFNMLDLTFTDDALLVADWEEMAFLSVDTSGSVLLPDIPRGRYIGPGAGARFPIRNPGKIPMNVDIYLDKPLHRDVQDWKAAYTLAPGETRLVEFSSSELEAYMDPLWREALVRVVSEASVCHKGSLGVPGDQRSGLVKLVERWDMDSPEDGHPAIGEDFPEIAIEGMSEQEEILPEPGVPTCLVFFGWDCAAMWPQLLDMSWLKTQGLVPEGLLPVALSRGSVADSEALGARWRVANVVRGTYNSNYGSVLSSNGPIFHGSDLYTAAFFIGDIPGGAEHPTDYLVGSDGQGSSFSLQRR